MSPAPGPRRLALRIGERLLAIGAARVSEVVADTAATPVPLAPAPVRGLALVRGRLVTVLDLAAALGLAAGPGDRRLLVLAPPLGHLGFEVAGPIELEPEPASSRDRAPELDVEGLLAGLEAAIDAGTGA